MSNLFLKMGTRVGSVRQFIEASESGNSLKYKGGVSVNHLIYFPYIDVQLEDGTIEKQLVAIQAGVHSWETNDGKYKTTICTDGKVVTDDDGNILYDGTCPFCERVSDAWDIYNYRYQLEEKTCGLMGQDLVKHMEDIKSDLARERKVKSADNFMYVLVAQIEIDNNNNVVVGQDGVPSYSLKIMRLSTNQINQLELAVKGAGEESLCGCEVLFSYGDGGSKDQATAKMLAMKDRVITIRSERIMATKRYPGLVDKINIDVDKFEWDGIEKTFREFQEMPASVRLQVVNGLFTEWDEYKARINSGDTSARYLEYNKAVNIKPSLGIENNAPKMPELTAGNAFVEENKLRSNLPQIDELNGNLDI